MKISWKCSKNTSMIRKKRQFGRSTRGSVGSGPSRLGCVVKIMTTRPICFLVIGALCCLSICLPLLRFTFDASQLQHKGTLAVQSINQPALRNRRQLRIDLLEVDRRFLNKDPSKRLIFEIPNNDAIRNQAILAAQNKKLFLRKQSVKGRLYGDKKLPRSIGDRPAPANDAAARLVMNDFPNPNERDEKARLGGNVGIDASLEQRARNQRASLSSINSPSNPANLRVQNSGTMAGLFQGMVQLRLEQTSFFCV